MKNLFDKLVWLVIVLTLVGQIRAAVIVQTRNGTKMEIYATQIIYVGK